MRSFQKKFLLSSGALTFLFLIAVCITQLYFSFIIIRSWALHDIRSTADYLESVAEREGFTSTVFSDAVHASRKTGITDTVVFDANDQIIDFHNDNNNALSENQVRDIIASATVPESTIKRMFNEFTRFYEGSFSFVHIQPIHQFPGGKYLGKVVVLFTIDTLAFLPQVLIAHFVSYLILWLLFLIGTTIFNERILKDTRRIVTTLEDMCSGNYSVRIICKTNDELNTIGSGINNLAATISANLSALEQKNAELEYAYQQLEAFADNASHELQSPLTGILSVSETLLEFPSDTETVMKGLSTINSAALRLSISVKNLLTLAKIDSCNSFKQNLILLETDISKLVMRTCGMLQRKWANKHLSLQFSVENHIFGNIEPDLTAIVFSNLLDNAFKYSPANEKIHVTLKKINSCAIFSVNNKGANLSPEQLSKIFDRYYRAPNDTVSGVEGTGIGLALTKRITELFGWEITSEGDIGKSLTIMLKINSVTSHTNQACSP